MPKFILKSETKIGSRTFYSDLTEEKALEIMRAKEPDEKWLTCKKVPKGKHICKYCGEIAEGTYDDLLCGDCRETFGHSLFSEL